MEFMKLPLLGFFSNNVLIHSYCPGVHEIAVARIFSNNILIHSYCHGVHEIAVARIFFK